MKTNKLINSSIVVPTSSEQPDPSLRIRFCSSWCQHYKTFFFVYDAKGIQARVFVPGSQGQGKGSKSKGSHPPGTILPMSSFQASNICKNNGVSLYVRSLRLYSMGMLQVIFLFSRRKNRIIYISVATIFQLLAGRPKVLLISKLPYNLIGGNTSLLCHVTEK